MKKKEDNENEKKQEKGMRKDERRSRIAPIILVSVFQRQSERPTRPRL